MLSAGVAEADNIISSDPSEAARTNLRREAQITCTESNAQVAQACEFLVLAVKPQAMNDVLAQLRPCVGERHFIASIAAGVPLAELREGLGPLPRLARVMPNTPALVGAGAAAYCLDHSANTEDERLLRSMLTAVGTAWCVSESVMDVVTGLSGSGPAFVYQVIEALSDGGVRMGLPREIATALAAQTVLGAAQMVLQTGLHPAVLKDQVTSPGGTTIAGLHALERGGLRAAIIDAVEAATRRASELWKPG
jgi:pyrroline-5-carboxylate reductase